jgi:hypothetical protein
MASSFYLIWEQPDITLRGYAATTGWVDGGLSFPVCFPQRYSEAKIVTLRSSARDSGTLETLKSVKFYLTGNATDLIQVQETWPYYGSSFSPNRVELNGGFEISFDEGRTYTRFSKTAGYASDPSTWISLPASAVGLNGIAGQLGPYDRARIYMRYRVPQQATNYKLLDVRLAVDFDIV